MAEEIKEKKCACKGGNLDRFIQPIILLILAEEADTGYGVFKKWVNFLCFGSPDRMQPVFTGIFASWNKESFWSSSKAERQKINIK